MGTVYLFCAAVGGSVLVVQFILTVIGIGGEDFDFDADVDIPDDVDLGGESHHSAVSHGSTWLFSVISFKTVVAALTFFGIAGLASYSAELPPFTTLAIGLAFGVSAMFLVHFMMQSLHKLNHDGSLRIGASVGKRGQVYVPIPGERSGEGKIQLRLQNRIVELKAMTGEPDKLPTGARVVISRVLTPSTVEVELLGKERPSEKSPTKLV